MSAVHWNRIVELARQVDTAHTNQDVVDVELALRLARAVMHFQEQLLGGLVRARVPARDATESPPPGRPGRE